MNVPNPMDKGAGASPDYAGAAAQQTIANRPNQSTPWASSTWTSGAPGVPRDGSLDSLQSRVAAIQNGGGAPGRDTQTTALSGPLGAANDSMMNQLGSAWSTPLDNGAQARQHAEDAIYGRETARLDPMWASRQHDLSTTLANQGIDPNSAAYSKSLGDFGRSRNDAYSSALQDAIMGGGQEATRQQQMDLTSRMAPLSAMGGLRSLTGMPGVGPAGDMLGAARSQGQYNQYAKAYGDEFWSNLIKGGASAFSGMGGGTPAFLPGGGNNAGAIGVG